MDKRVRKIVRKDIFIILILIFGLTCLPISGQAQSRNYTSADRQTFFNDVSDYFATLGMSPQEMKKARRERHDIRKAIRVEKARANKNAKKQKNIRKQQKEIMDKIEAEKEAKERRRLKRNEHIEMLNEEKPVDNDNSSSY